jgi:hypothetical protein
MKPVMLFGLILCPTSVLGQIDSLEQFGEFAQTYYTDPRPGCS